MPRPSGYVHPSNIPPIFPVPSKIYHQTVKQGELVHPTERTSDWPRPSGSKSEFFQKIASAAADWKNREHNGTPSARTTRAPQTAQEIVTRMTDRYTKLLSNYSDFLGKVQTRLTTLTSSGVDVTSINTLVTTATTDLATAQTAFTTVKSNLATLDYTATGATLAQNITTAIAPLRQSLTTLHTDMSNIVSAIKASSIGISETPGQSTQTHSQHKEASVSGRRYTPDFHRGQNPIQVRGQNQRGDNQ